MKKKSIVIFCVVLAVLILAATLIGILVPKHIKVGVVLGSPMAYKTFGGEWTGFDIDFANKMFGEMDRVPEYIEVTARTAEQMLKKGEIDCYMSATDLISDKFIMSDSYVSAVQVVLHKTIEGIEINTLDDLKYYRVGVLTNSKNRKLLEKYIARQNILKHATNEEMVEMLDIGDIGVAIVDYAFAQNFVNNKDYKVGVIFDTLENKIVFSPKNKNVCKKANEIIEKYKKDGYFDTLKDQYKMQEYYK